MVWKWCSEVYLQHGTRLAFPKDTDCKKTYQWRFIKSLAQKFEDWEFDDQTCRKFIEVAIKKFYKQRHKGLSIFHQKNMIDIVYKDLLKTINHDKDTISSISSSHAWIQNHADSDTAKSLLYRRNIDCLRNIVMWYNANKIDDLYLALSAPCYKALTVLEQIDAIQRKMLPSAAKLYLVRSEFNKDKSRVDRARQILGKDFR